MISFKAHETAVMETNDIGEGTRIWHFAHVRDGAKIGKGCNIGKSVYVDTGAVIGDNVKVQNFVSIYKGVVIEDDVFIGPSVTFTNDLHPRAFIWEKEQVAPTHVGKGASIGANSTIICGNDIGDYAMVGAGSVVTRDIPPFALAYGSPAEIKGWVCYCGKRLEEILNKSGGRTRYKCSSCGKAVEVVDEWTKK